MCSRQDPVSADNGASAAVSTWNLEADLPWPGSIYSLCATNNTTARSCWTLATFWGPRSSMLLSLTFKLLNQFRHCSTRQMDRLNDYIDVWSIIQVRKSPKLDSVHHSSKWGNASSLKHDVQINRIKFWGFTLLFHVCHREHSSLPIHWSVTALEKHSKLKVKKTAHFINAVVCMKWALSDMWLCIPVSELWLY